MNQKTIDKVNAAFITGEDVIILDNRGHYEEVFFESHADWEGIWLGHEELREWGDIHRVITATTIVEIP